MPGDGKGPALRQELNGEFVLRAATKNDIPAIVDVNAAAYPAMAELGMVWRPRHLESHLRVFPQGQLVVEHQGRVVGAASSLVVSLGRDPCRDHTWAGITDNGYFYNHDPYGDTLYGADVNVHPEYRRRGIGALLYRGRERLCKQLNLRRIVLGGRLIDYAEHADRMSAEEYAWRVEAGELRDPVLTFQLSQGFALKKVMDNYLRDPRSKNHATFLEWFNPDYDSSLKKARAIRVSCVQYKMRRIKKFKGFARKVRYFVDVAADYDADFVVFPELLTAQLMSFIDVKTPQEAIRRLTDYTEQVDELFKELATEFQLAIVGGSHPIRSGDRIENVASLYLPTGEVHRQPKIHMTPDERRAWGMEGGSTLQVFDTDKARVGILVCYDVEFPETARYLCDNGAEVIFVPFCTDDRQGYLRVRYCAQARAVENQCYVALAGTVGNMPDVENMDTQYAQSAVLSPSDFLFARDGIMVEAAVNTEQIVTTDLDLEALQEAINEGTVRQRQDRRPDLFSFHAAVPGEAARPPEG